ncbi:hypothetical protein Fbal_1585 [Ferrimonas balearica DSM 9799]|uniref:Uncharacterized protein n=1 Tax=Ferrimonas balearica (strain DSM 9799 / CCM 4581 / KCTC 23876 / PAT) TaxID=550540 RepID=E1SPZ4_FERBD|nr:hypothetical protein [Ferrimonas balearica]ADN75789.1 hypothetical protein Fbal_1585 [Ferrimonas balearica DSM 9799]
MREPRRATLNEPLAPPSGPNGGQENVLPHDPLSLVIEVNLKASDSIKVNKLHVYRLAYRGVPKLEANGKGNKEFNPVEAEFMAERYPLVVTIFQWLSEVAQKNGNTAYGFFNCITPLIRFWDEKGIKAELSKLPFKAYAEWVRKTILNEPNRKGRLKTINSVINLFLNWAGQEDLAKLVPKITKPSAPTTVSYTDEEMRGVRIDLFRVFNVLSSRLIKCEPTDCPFDQPDGNGWWAVNPNGNETAWLTKWVCSAYLITASYTGDNTTPLMKLRMSDIENREYSFDKTINLYRLTTAKGRQGGKENVWEVGFTKTGREFFESYLKLIQRFEIPEDGYVFPNIINGQYHGQLSSNILDKFCRWFTRRSHHGVRPVVRRFRISKSDGLIAATGSISLVAEGLNNLTSTIEKHYASGNPHANNNSLGSAAEAQVLTAKGASMEEAREKVKAKYGKPMRVKDITETGEQEPTRTTVGSRCKQPFGEKAKALKAEMLRGGMLREEEKDAEMACFKFLDCFECDFQALVAEVDDIWCMLSFQESLIEALQRPTVNHFEIPVGKIQDVIKATQKMLRDVQQEYPQIFAEAMAKFDNETHPMWDDEDALLDIYGIW